jgi:hypothetical protein
MMNRPRGASTSSPLNGAHTTGPHTSNAQFKKTPTNKTTVYDGMLQGTAVS